VGERVRQRPRSGGRALAFLVLALLLAAIGSNPAARAADATPQAVGSPEAATSPVAGPDCVAINAQSAPGLKGGDACITFVTGSPDAPPVDLYVDGVKLIENQAYRADAYRSEEIKGIASGKRRIQIVATGKDPSTALIDKSLIFNPGSAYDLIIYDNLAKNRFAAYAVDLATLPAKASRVRVINAGGDLSAPSTATSSPRGKRSTAPSASLTT
jgi:hypothetical protein